MFAIQGSHLQDIVQEIRNTEKLIEETKTLTYRRLVMPADLNFGDKLFGGQLMKWVDEAAAMYVMCQLDTKNVVTKKISEILFNQPVEKGDFLLFYASLSSVGTTSVDVHIDVYKKVIEPKGDDINVLSCDLKFVKIDPVTKRPVPHGLSKA